MCDTDCQIAVEAARGESEKWQRLYDEAQQRVIVYEAELAQARVMATNYKADAELQSERVTELRTDLLPQIASLQADLAQARARIAELERVAEAAWHLCNELSEGDDLGIGVWEKRTIAALDAAQEQPGTS